MVKKQHYVPRVLLRCFSTDSDKKLINIYNLKTKSIILNGPLKNQAYEDYLYGKDQKLENEYQKIETKMDTVFKDISDNNFSITKEDLFYIKIFMNFQISRTPIMKHKMLEMNNMLIANIAECDKEVEEILHSEMSKNEDPFITLFKIAKESSFVLSDLKLGVLINNSRIPFIIGQHPVIVLNPFLVERKWPNSRSGLANKGAILYMPIGSSLGIILYDPLRYKLTSFKKSVIIDEQDVHKLNTVQFASTQECVFYNSNMSLEQLNTYYDFTKNYRSSEKTKIEKLKCTILNKPGIHEILHTTQVDLPIDQKFNFVGITEAAYYEDLGSTMDISREAIKPYLNHNYSGRYEIKRKK